jgi:hypothetical protein
MLQFVWGTLIGLSIGYPLGLWAMSYTNEKREDVR